MEVWKWTKYIKEGEKVVSNSSKIGNATFLFACVCLVVFSTCSFAKVSVGPQVFEYRDGLISLKGDGLSLLPLLQRISESTGIQILVFGSLSPYPVSVDMIDKPVEEALKSILRGYSYAAIYSDGSAGGVNIIGARGGRETNLLVTSQKNRVSRIDLPPTSVSSTGQAPLFAPEEEEGVGNVDRTSRDQTAAVQNHEEIAGKGNPLPSELRTYIGSNKGAERPVIYVPTQSVGTRARQQTEAVGQQTEAIARAAMATREGGYSVFIEELERRIESGQSDRDYELWSRIKGPRYVEHDRVRLERYRELLDR